MSADETTFTINDCPGNEDILFTISTRSEDDEFGDGIIGGDFQKHIL